MNPTYYESISVTWAIILLFLVTSDEINFLSILPKSRRQLVWVEPWLQRRSTRCVYQNLISELNLQKRYDYRKCFSMNIEIS